MKEARKKPWNIEAETMNQQYMELSAINVMMVFPIIMNARSQSGKHFAIRLTQKKLQN